MKKQRILSAVMALLLFVSCSKKNAENFNSEYSLFKDYILNYSPSIISSSDDIRVVLAFDNQDWSENKELDQNLFKINPSIKGKVVALSSNTVAFIPTEKLNQNTSYQVSFQLGELKQVDKKLKEFNFTTKTIKQDFMVSVIDLQSYSKDFQYINGVLNTSDNLDFETAKKLIQVSQKDKK
nr:Ig-like domain-containing protein [Flavobacterium haoranii]